MTVHLIVLTYICLAGLVIYRGRRATKRMNKRFLIACMFGIWLVTTLRSASVGWDTSVYVADFQRAADAQIVTTLRYEPLYNLTLYTLGRLTNSYVIYHAVTAFVMLYGLGYMLYNCLEDGESMFFAMLLFFGLGFYFHEMNITRQVMSMAFACNVYTVMRRGRTRKNLLVSILLLTIGLLFHYWAAIDALVLLAFVFKKITKKHIVWVAIVALIAVFAMDQILSLFFSATTYGRYATSFRREGTEGLGLYHIVLLIFKLFLVISACCLDEKKEGNQEIYRLAFLCAISVAFTVLKTSISLAQRAGYSFELYFCLLAPKVLNRYHGRTRGILKAMTFILAVAAFIVSLSNATGHRGTVPYTFVWELPY